MLSCRDASQLLSQAQERRLNWHERLLLRLHLVLCDGCRNFRSQLAIMREAMRRYRDGVLPR